MTKAKKGALFISKKVAHVIILIILRVFFCANLSALNRHKMLQLARARVVRGDPVTTSTKSTVLESFPLYGNRKTSLVCTSHDLLKSQVVVLHAQDHLDLMLQLDAAVPTCAWQQIDESHHGGGVLHKFGVRDYVVNKTCSHDVTAGKCSFPFVGVGNCIGNVWPDDDVDGGGGLYPCTLYLQFIEAVPRGSAILMGSLHSLKSLYDVPYLTVNETRSRHTHTHTPSLSLAANSISDQSHTPCTGGSELR